MKKILNIRYPKKITNNLLSRISQKKSHCFYIFYRRAGVSLVIIILRRNKDIAANKAARSYFIPNGNKMQGQSKTNLPFVFNRDLTLIQNLITLHSSKDLAEITELAQVKKYWRGLTSQSRKLPMSHRVRTGM